MRPITTQNIQKLLSSRWCDNSKRYQLRSDLLPARHARSYICLSFLVLRGFTAMVSVAKHVAVKGCGNGVMNNSHTVWLALRDCNQCCPELCANVYSISLTVLHELVPPTSIKSLDPADTLNTIAYGSYNGRPAGT